MFPETVQVSYYITNGLHSPHIYSNSNASNNGSYTVTLPASLTPGNYFFMVRISNGYRYYTTLPFVIANIMKASSHSPQTSPSQEQPSQSTVAVESEFFLYDDKNWLIKKLEPKSSLASQLPVSGKYYIKACRGDVYIQSGLFGE